ncbi:prenylated rab acceptor 1 [Podospora appendiculata]|uniref:Prenylated rab acceptor 1 n=1 Tax=Podospora appendiculata TaxID=314037 RepID=A0AAE0XIY4_9PEZI|nr:prenylated rab acceptor 1 [Podospora appendiculata]
MARIQIPIEALTSRLNLQERFASVRSTSLASRFSNMRPLWEFFDMKRVSKPANFAEVQSRVNYNLGHFSSNYAVLFAMLSIYALVTNPWLLFDIIALVGGTYLIGKLEGRDLEIGQHRYTTSQLYTVLYLTTIPIALIFASILSTGLWLIGASGVTIIGHAAFMDKPIDEAFSGEAGRWTSGQRVEELDSGDDTDTQGVALASTAVGKRFVSDPLRFTGIDLGDRTDGETRSRRRNNYRSNDEDEESDTSEDEAAHDSDSSSSNSGSEHGQVPLLDKEEEALVESALERIQRARAKGKDEVKLSKKELAALERRRQRMQGEERKKKKEQRIAVPLSHLEPATTPTTATSSTTRKKRNSLPGITPPQRKPSDSNEGQQHEVYPPMGYFPPPASRSLRQRSGTGSSRPPSRSAVDREQSSSPFTYSYVQQGDHTASLRHSSDPVIIGVRSRNPPSHGGSPATDSHNSPAAPLRGSGPPAPEPSRQPQAGIDPFQYMTGGARAAYHAGTGPARQTVSGLPSDPRSGPSPATGRSGRRRSKDESSEEETSSEEDKRASGPRHHEQGARMGSSGRGRVQEVITVIEGRPSSAQDRRRSQEEPPPAAPKNAPSPPVKRKAVATGTTGGRRRKGK